MAMSMVSSAARGAAVFLDKDGTLLTDLPYNVDPARMAYARGAFLGLRRLGACGVPLIVVTNQPGIAQGRYPAEAMHVVRRRLEGMFRAAGAELSGYYWCPHAPAEGCTCRKPGPGLLERAAGDMGLDLSACWLIGDILDDVEAASRAGCRSVLVDCGGETQWRGGPGRTPTLTVPDFDLAARAVAQALREEGRFVGMAA